MIDTTTPEWIKQVSALQFEVESMIANIVSGGCTVLQYPFEISVRDENGNVKLTMSCSTHPPTIPEISEALSKMHVSKKAQP